MGLIIKGSVINDSTGTIQTKCPRCGDYNVIKGPANIEELKCECGYIFITKPNESNS